MKTTFSRCAVLAVCLSTGSMHGQTQKTGAINSSYPVTVPAIAGIAFSQVSLAVSYPTGLTPGSYISGTQLNTDFQGFLSAYPSPQDPPEAILSAVLQSVLNKYPQMNGGSVTGFIASSVQGISIPVGGGTVIVTIGNYGLTGIITGAASAPKPKPAAAN